MEKPYVYDRTTGQYVLKEIKTQTDIEYWTQKVADAKVTLNKAQATLDNLLAQLAGDTPEVTIKRLQLELANGNVDDAQAAIEVARKSVENAQKNLDDARAKSPVITAPFDGFITQVNVAGGDEVLNGTVAVQIADPSKFEAEVMVGETDIMQVNIDGTASVQVDAMPGISLPATVTHISPTATIQSGVVNYTVKVEIQPTEAKKQAGNSTIPSVSDNTSPGGLSPRLQQAVDAGNMTQAQAEAMMSQFQQGQAGQRSKVTTAMTANLQLKEGLTVTVNIITDERNNVLLVPNAAITTQGGKTFVQVLAADGTQAQREIQTGLSDYRSTEVTSGLSEGEQIIVPAGTATTPTTPSSQNQPRGMFIPGVGRMR